MTEARPVRTSSTMAFSVAKPAAWRTFGAWYIIVLTPVVWLKMPMKHPMMRTRRVQGVRKI